MPYNDLTHRNGRPDAACHHRWSGARRVRGGTSACGTGRAGPPLRDAPRHHAAGSSHWGLRRAGVFELPERDGSCLGRWPPQARAQRTGIVRLGCSVPLSSTRGLRSGGGSHSVLADAHPDGPLSPGDHGDPPGDHGHPGRRRHRGGRPPPGRCSGKRADGPRRLRETRVLRCSRTDHLHRVPGPQADLLGLTLGQGRRRLPQLPTDA